jgi:ribonuclease HI
VPIWVDATLLNWCKAKLRSVQRLMLNSFMGSFRSTSSKSALILSNETPIEMRAQELATLSSLKGYHSSSKVVRNILEHIEINILNIDFPCSSFNSSHPPFEPLPTLTINTTTNYPSLLPNSEDEFYVFTDGSKSVAGVGCAIVVTDSTAIHAIHKIRLPEFSGIFEAEAYAIKYALRSIRKLHSPGRKFSIFSDSQSVLKAVSSSSKTVPIIRQIQKRTSNLLRQSINIQFHWVPGHKNIHGNELADKAARAAVNNPIDTTHNIKIPWSHCKPLLKEYFQTLWNTEWALVDPTNITKSFFPTPSSARILKSIHLSRQLVQVLSGHSKLRSFLHRIGIEPEGTCSCQADTETTQHFLFDCQLYHSLRLPVLHSCRNIPWPPPLLYFTSSIKKLALLKSFIHNTKRL